MKILEKLNEKKNILLMDAMGIGTFTGIVFSIIWGTLLILFGEINIWGILTGVLMLGMGGFVFGIIPYFVMKREMSALAYSLKSTLLFGVIMWYLIYLKIGFSEALDVLMYLWLLLRFGVASVIAFILWMKVSR